MIKNTKNEASSTSKSAFTLHFSNITLALNEDIPIQKTTATVTL